MLLYTTSLAYIRAGEPQGIRSLSTHVIKTVSHYYGQALLRTLDKFLTPQSLSKKCDASTRSTFLLVLGTILAISYTSSIQCSPQINIHPQPGSHDGLPEQPEHQNLWAAMREHLCEMLSHHLILLGSRIGIRFPQSSQRDIITSAVNRWGKRGSFTWQESTPWSNVQDLSSLPHLATTSPSRPNEILDLPVLSYLSSCTTAAESFGFGENYQDFGSAALETNRPCHFDLTSLSGRQSCESEIITQLPPKPYVCCAPQRCTTRKSRIRTGQVCIYCKVSRPRQQDSEVQTFHFVCRKCIRNDGFQIQVPQTLQPVSDGRESRCFLSTPKKISRVSIC